VLLDTECSSPSGRHLLVQETAAPIRNSDNLPRNFYIPNLFRSTAKAAFKVIMLYLCVLYFLRHDKLTTAFAACR
jgi:hypothetical protein